MYKTILLTTLLFIVKEYKAQEDLLGSLDSSATADDNVIATFKTTRLINLTTNEQVKKGELDFRIAHRFEDAATAAGGTTTLFGFDAVSDIRISFDYGISDKWAIGVGRSKGGGRAHSQIYDFNTKYKIIQQSTKMPIGISFYGLATLTSMKSVSDPTSIADFSKTFAHRLHYMGQILIAKKINSNFSFIIAPTVVHRNLVVSGDPNTQFAIGAGLRYKFSKRSAIILDYYQVLNPTVSHSYVMPLGIGYEIETGGHVFHVLLSNNRSLVESELISENRDKWQDGQFRIGFNISRTFTVLKN